MSVTITITVDGGDGVPVRVQVVGLAACDCGTSTGEHEPDCAGVALGEPLRQRVWPYWFRRERHHRPTQRRRP